MKKKYELTDDPTKNRTVLKRFIKDHADKFNMSIWIAREYIEARAARDAKGMAAAGLKAIDYYAKTKKK